MSRNSENRLKTQAAPNHVDRPFDQTVLRKAKSLVSQYRITLERNERLGFIGSSVELPTVFADAQSLEDCYEATQNALAVAAATMFECGQTPPQPVSARKRTEQVNVRLTAEEKMVLSNAASTFGFRGISDFLRNAAMNRVLPAR